MATLYGPPPGPPEPLRRVDDLAGSPVDDVDGRHAGHVSGALVDAGSGLIRYLDVSVADADRHVLIPIGHAEVQRTDGEARIRLRVAAKTELYEIPEYVEHGPPPDDAYHQAVLDAHGRLFHDERYYAHPAYDHSGLYAGEHPIVCDVPPPPAREPLRRLSRLPGYRVAEDEPDIRGWPLHAGSGERVGTVSDLIVDPEASKVRYVVVTLAPDSRTTLIPVGFVRIDEEARSLQAPALTAEDLAALPDVEGDPSRADELRIRAALEARLVGPRRFDGPDFSPARGRSDQHAP